MRSYSFDVQISKVSCGYDHSGFITSEIYCFDFKGEGLLFVMGSNKHSKLGVGSTYQQV